MKKVQFVRILILYLIVNSYLNATNAQSEGKSYEIAIDKIRLDQGFDKRPMNGCKFNVSSEILSTRSLAIFFKKELGTQFESISPPVKEDSNLVVKTYGYLNKLGCKENRELKIFFTEIKQGYFFAEMLIYENKSLMSYDKRSHFGESKVFMFKVDGDNVTLVNSQLINYN